MISAGAFFSNYVAIAENMARVLFPDKNHLGRQTFKRRADGFGIEQHRADHVLFHIHRLGGILSPTFSALKRLPRRGNSSFFKSSQVPRFKFLIAFQIGTDGRRLRKPGRPIRRVPGARRPGFFRNAKLPARSLRREAKSWGRPPMQIRARGRAACAQCLCAPTTGPPAVFSSAK